jgi:hypothetical protein
MKGWQKQVKPQTCLGGYTLPIETTGGKQQLIRKLEGSPFILKN